MKEQPIELVFMLNVGTTAICIYRARDNGKWVYNTVERSWDRPGRRRNFKSLKSFKKVQTNQLWTDDIVSILSATGQLEDYDNMYTTNNYVHPDYRTVVQKEVDRLIEFITDEWDEEFSVNMR